MLLRKACLYLLFLSVSSMAYAQGTAASPHLELAKVYQKKFEKATAILLKAETTLEFSLDAKTDAPFILETESQQLMSLRTASKSSIVKAYNDYSRIEKASLTNHKGRQIPTTPICGNYEIGSIFYSDAKVCRYDLSFDIPGEIQHFSLQRKYNDLKYFTSIYFNDAFPASVRKISFIIPHWLDVELKEMNFQGYKIAKSVIPNPQKQTTTYEYTIENIDSFKDESYAQGYSYTYPHIVLVSKSYTSNGQSYPIIGSLTDLYKWYASLVQEVKNDPKSLEPIVKQLLAGKSSDEEKIKTIYYWVQDHIRYIAFEEGIAGFKPECAQNVLSNKYGDCKGMANLTKEMLKLAGYDARLTWIGTNKIAYDYSLPSLAVDNHMICTVLLNNHKYFLDATEKFIPFNEYAERIQGRQVLIEDGENFILDRIPIGTKDNNRVVIEHTLKVTGNTLAGVGKTEYKGEMQRGLLRLLQESPTEKKMGLLEKVITQSDKNIRIDKLLHSNLSSREKALILSYELAAQNQLSSFEDELYVGLDYDHMFTDFAIKPERVSEVNFDEKMLRITRVTFKLPEGYLVSYLPKNFNTKHEAFQLQINFKESKGEIHYEKIIAIEQGIIAKKDFASWNQAIEELKQTSKDKIILIKKK